MGCGQSKINLYPRRNKGGGKGHGSKKSAGGDSKDGDDDETSNSGNLESPREGGHSSSGGAGSLATKPRPPPAPPHALGHAASTEISASQLDFFKMLDEKIEKGRDYDSSSETEIQIEQARVSSLLQSWDAASQSSLQYCMATSSPPTPRSAQRFGRGVTSASPPVRRGHHDSNSSIEKEQQKTGSPSKRTTQTTSWKVNAKGQTQPLQMKPGQKLDSCDDQRCYSPQLLTQREIHQSYGVSLEYIDSARESSQITYNPTFQTHSPIHTAKNTSQSVPQPYIAQIITYPMSQQAVSYQGPSQKYISPSPPFQQPTPQQQPPTPQVQVAQPLPPIPVAPQPPQQRFPGRIPPAQQMQPSNIYYITSTSMIQPPIPTDQVLTPKQQTALHLQQYVAMKQAQQAMGYQRMMSGQDYSFYTQGEGTATTGYGRKSYDRPDDPNYSLNFMTLGRQSTSQKAVLQTQVMRPMSPSLIQFQQGQVAAPVQTPAQQIPLQRTQINPSVFQNSPGCTASLGRNQSLLHHKDLISDRFGQGVQCTVASSLTTTPQNNPTNVARSNLCQSLNIVTQKTVGQIVPIGTNQDLIIYQNVNDSGSSGSVSRTSSNNSVVNTSLEMSTFKDVSKSNTDQTDLSKIVSVKPHIVPAIGRQVYYSQVVSSATPPDQAAQQKVSISNSFSANNGGEVKKSSIDASTTKNSVRTLIHNKSSSMDKNGSDYL